MNEPSPVLPISVVIPTFNRPRSLRGTLQALARQRFAAKAYEVIVVDDGSEESYDGVLGNQWQFPLSLLRQPNQGEAVARNYGASRARGELLVFLDDDILTEPQYLGAMHDEYLAFPDSLLIATLHDKVSPQDSLFRRIMRDEDNWMSFGEVPFTQVLAGVLAVPRGIYTSLGGMYPPRGGKRGGWVDMEFSYRAHLAGYRLRRCAGAVAYHDDYASQDLHQHLNRAYQVSRLAAYLFQQYPALKCEIPMFKDKLPICWTQDPPTTILRKIIRSLASSPFSLWVLGQIAHLLENHYPSRILLRRVYRWLTGAHIYRGYREGLRQLGL